MDFSEVRWEEVGTASIETLQILAVSGLFTVLLGLPLGVILFMTGRSASPGSKLTYIILSVIVNILRSVPFIILIVALIPFTRTLVGTATGVLGVIPPLVISAAPYFARLVENTLREVDRGVIEAAQAMGHLQLRSSDVYCCLRLYLACLPELQLPSLRWCPIRPWRVWLAVEVWVH